MSELRILLDSGGDRIKSVECLHRSDLAAEAGRVSASLTVKFGAGFEDVACTQDASFFGDLRIPEALFKTRNCKWVSIRLSHTSPLVCLCCEACLLPEYVERIKTVLEELGYIVVLEDVFFTSAPVSAVQPVTQPVCTHIQFRRSDLWEELFGHW